MDGRPAHTVLQIGVRSINQALFGDMIGSDWSCNHKDGLADGGEGLVDGKTKLVEKVQGI